MKLTLLGAPGAGKGTQSDILSRKLGVPTISTGNILRSAIHDGTSVGLAAKSYIDKGQLVPDNVIIDIVQERLSKPDCANGFILDGMPRTIPQAEALIAHGIELDSVLSLEVSDEDIVERMAGRRVCPRCGASYHVRMNPPKQDGICDACGTASARTTRPRPCATVCMSTMNRPSRSRAFTKSWGCFTVWKTSAASKM